MVGAKAYMEYTEQSIYTSSPGDILLMLFNAELKNIKAAILFIQKNRYKEAHERLLKAQDIMTELISSLDFSYKISDDLSKLYSFIKNELIYANIHKDTDRLSQLLPIVTELRDAWDRANSMSTPLASK
ncbi:MAG: flagellar export chaperone FliS [Clostridiales bacterium]|nr:flagellar export chaperone FliS [Clostridiales bacterium]